MPSKAPTAQQRRYWNEIVELGCILAPSSTCAGRTTIHHCGTGDGGRKDHDKVIGLCWEHHLGREGIDGKRMSKRAWQEKYGSEDLLLQKTISDVTTLLLAREFHRKTTLTLEEIEKCST